MGAVASEEFAAGPSTTAERVGGAASSAARGPDTGGGPASSAAAGGPCRADKGTSVAGWASRLVGSSSGVGAAAAAAGDADAGLTEDSSSVGGPVDAAGACAKLTRWFAIFSDATTSASRTSSTPPA